MVLSSMTGTIVSEADQPLLVLARAGAVAQVTSHWLESRNAVGPGSAKKRSKGISQALLAGCAAGEDTASQTVS